MGIEPRFNRTERNLVKALTFAGAILGVGAIGLAKTLMVFAEELRWISHRPSLGPAVLWILGGAAAGFVGSYLLVRARKRR
jgi:hypothetical protein